MATRKLTLVYYKGKYYIAQYGHRDGSPSHQGRIILEFLHNTSNIQRLQHALDAKMIFVPDQKQLDEYYGDAKQVWQEARDQLADFEEYRPCPPVPGPARDAWRQQFDLLGEAVSAPLMFVQPSLAHTCGAQILSLVANARDKIPVTRQLSFMDDSLFCEWTYVVDLDERVFEVWSHRWRQDLHFGGSDRFDGELIECVITADGNSEDGSFRVTTKPNFLGKFGFDELPDGEQFVDLFEPARDKLYGGADAGIASDDVECKGISIEESI